MEADTLNHVNEIRSCKVIDNETESNSNNEHDKTNYDHTNKELAKGESLNDLAKRQNQIFRYSDRDIEKQKTYDSRETSFDNKILKIISLN